MAMTEGLLRRILLFAGLVTGVFLGYALFSDAAHAADKTCCVVTGPVQLPATQTVGSIVRTVPGAVRALPAPPPLTGVVSSVTTVVERAVSGTLDRGVATVPALVPVKPPILPAAPVVVAPPRVPAPSRLLPPPGSAAPQATATNPSAPGVAAPTFQVRVLAPAVAVTTAPTPAYDTGLGVVRSAERPAAPESPGTPPPAGATTSASAGAGAAQHRSPDARGAGLSFADALTLLGEPAGSTARRPVAVAIRPGVRPD